MSKTNVRIFVVLAGLEKLNKKYMSGFGTIPTEKMPEFMEEFDNLLEKVYGIKKKRCKK